MSEEEDLLTLIKDCWPDFKVSKDILVRPTHELVVRFYSRFVNNYNDKVKYLTGVPALVEITGDYDQEELLFQEVSKLLKKIHSLKASLDDIYYPSRRRTKHFFTVAIHFLAFIDNVLDDIDELFTRVFKARDDIGNLLEEQQQLLIDIHENANHKAEISESLNDLEQEYKSVECSSKKMKEKKAAKEKLYAEMKNEIEMLKGEMQNEERELKQMERNEKELSEQKITEREYQNIQCTLATLKAESEELNLDDVNIEDDLVHEKKVLNHGTICLSGLSTLYFNMENLQKLNKEDDQRKVVLNALENRQATLNALKQQKLESEGKPELLNSQLVNLRNEYTSSNEHHLNSKKQFSQELDKLKGDIDRNSQQNDKIILGYREDIAKLDDDMEKLKKSFTVQYVKVSNVEKLVMEKFRNILLKYNNL